MDPEEQQGGRTRPTTFSAPSRLAIACRSKGDLATIGHHRAIADFGRVRLAGSLAWWFWLFLHIPYLADSATGECAHRVGIRHFMHERGRATDEWFPSSRHSVILSSRLTLV